MTEWQKLSLNNGDQSYKQYMKAKLIKTKEGLYHLKFNNEADMMDCSLGLLSLKNCEAIERGYDLDEIKEIDLSWQYKPILDIEYITRSLKQTEWNCIVEMEYIGKCNGNNDDGCFQESPGHNCRCFERTPKLDADGYLILKRIS